MLSNAIIQKVIEELNVITKINMSVYDDSGIKVVETSDMNIDSRILSDFVDSEADSQVAGANSYFRVRSADDASYIVITEGTGEEARTFGQIAVSQLSNLMDAYRDRLDKTSFFQNLIMDNMLLVDIHNRAQKLHIENDVRRVVYIIETKNDRDNIAMEVLKGLYYDNAGNHILSVNEQSIILIKDLDSNATRDDIADIAKSILDILNTEAMINVRVAYGLTVKELKDISKSYKEAQMALDVGNIFFGSKNILSYENLGIGRLIYQLPESLCRLFVKEVFGDSRPEDIDEETLTTVYKFFENSLNVSETSRQLFIHRNTLVYRMEKLQKAIGLDMRVFDDALTFKIAMMVVDYINYLNGVDD